MIRIEIPHSSNPYSWVHEITAAHRVADSLRKHGIPCTGRLAVTGVERGTLNLVFADGALTLTFAEPGETGLATGLKVTHEADGVRVLKSGVHLVEQDDEDLF